MPIMTFHLSPSGTPLFDIAAGDYARFRALGAWATGEIGKNHGVVLDGLATVDDARQGRSVEPWSSESYEVAIYAGGIRFENFYAEAERGQYSLDELSDVLEEYWRFLTLLPEPPGAQRAYWPELPRAEAEVRLWEQLWKRPHPYRGRLF